MRARTWAAAAAAGAGWYWWENHSLSRTRLTLVCPDLPEAFSGLRIVHLSDLHGAWFGAGQARLLRQVEALRPDLIFLTGDLLCSRKPRLGPALALGQGCADLTPTYFTSGNHEDRMPEEAELLRRGLAASGVVVLEDQLRVLTRGGRRLSVLGLSDRTCRGGDPALRLGQLTRQAAGSFRLLLSHRPERMALYTALGIEVVFSGHAHGGQIRLPGIGGLFAPDQGVLPRYTAGAYRVGPTAMVVSRGLGPSQFPLRMGNRPEIVLVRLIRRPEET